MNMQHYSLNTSIKLGIVIAFTLSLCASAMAQGNADDLAKAEKLYAKAMSSGNPKKKAENLAQAAELGLTKAYLPAAEAVEAFSGLAFAEKYYAKAFDAGLMDGMACWEVACRLSNSMSTMDMCPKYFVAAAESDDEAVWRLLLENAKDIKNLKKSDATYALEYAQYGYVNKSRPASTHYIFFQLSVDNKNERAYKYLMDRVALKDPYAMSVVAWYTYRGEGLFTQDQKRRSN